MKTGDVVRLSPDYNQGKWANALALILAHKPEQSDIVPARSGADPYRVEFYEVLCKDEIWDAPDWSLLEVTDENW